MAGLIVVIVSWNTRELTRNCLRSLFDNLSGINNEVWVVDNCSSDGSAEMIRSEFPQIKLIENPENVGFARANNQALRQADGDYYLLLNSDTVVSKGSIMALCDYMDENPAVATVGPRLTDGHTIQRSAAPLPTLSGELKHCLVYHFYPFGRIFEKLFLDRYIDYESADRPIEVEVLSAACLLIRKKVIEEVGLLSEDYFLFSEENDYFTRMRRAGLKSYYLPGIEIIHLIGKSREKRLKIDSEVNFFRSRMLYFRKFHNRDMFLFKAVYYFFFGWSYVLATFSRIIFAKGEYSEMYNRLWHTLRSGG
jgi:GT2 family glycosyltransferase